jgi:hypothetical protein
VDPLIDIPSLSLMLEKRLLSKLFLDSKVLLKLNLWKLLKARYQLSKQQSMEILKSNFKQHLICSTKNKRVTMIIKVS